MKNLLSALSDIIFPPLCLSCGIVVNEDNSGFCPSCLAKLALIDSPLCSCCGVPFISADTGDHPCADCITRNPPFPVARSMGRYETVLMEVIHRFKYGNNTAIGEVLGRMMAEYDYPGFTGAGYSMIMPVPLHPKRLRERGFNQSLILARELSDCFSIPLDFMSLRRHRYTEPQINLGRKEREQNVRGAFSIAKPELVKGKRVILVDDVYTTGSTLKECAGILMAADAEEVAVLTLARAV